MATASRRSGKPARGRSSRKQIVIILACTLATTALALGLINISIDKLALAKTGNDLAAAREIYSDMLDNLQYVLSFTADNHRFKQILLRKTTDELQVELCAIKGREGLDLLTVTNANGKVLRRSCRSFINDDDISTLKPINVALTEKRAVSSTELLDKHLLLKEDNVIVQRTWIASLAQSDNPAAGAGLLMCAAAPLLDNTGNIRGVLFGGVLLNKNTRIADRIARTLYHSTKYKGRPIGSVNIFLADFCVATSSHASDSPISLGATVPAEIRDRVIVQRKSWSLRGSPFNNDYFAAFGPIFNFESQVIGMLDTNLLAKKYDDMRKKSSVFLAALALLGFFLTLMSFGLISR